MPPEAHANAWVADRCCHYLNQEATAERPFFLHVGFPDPHHPFRCPEPWGSLYDPADIPLPESDPASHASRPPEYNAFMRGVLNKAILGDGDFHSHDLTQLTEAQIRLIHAKTYGMISFVDHQVGRILDTLDGTGLRENTIVVLQSEMGRIIDAYLLRDKGDASLWYCCFKQNGMSIACSSDLECWTFLRSAPMGGNVCVLVENDRYLVFHAPENGIGVKSSSTLTDWTDEGVFTLGQSDWPWAAKRLTAGFVIDLRHVREIGKYLLLFHGSSDRWDKNRNAHGHCSIGMAWSEDLVNWYWPNKPDPRNRERSTKVSTA